MNIETKNKIKQKYLVVVSKGKPRKELLRIASDVSWETPFPVFT